jgi:hypothetical protein
MNREQFLEYVDHFNNKRYDAVTGYFAPDVTVEYSSVWGDRTLHGPGEFIEHYKFLHEHAREVMELGDFMASGDLLFVELYTEFHCIKDLPASAGMTMKKGEVSVMTNWVLYNFEKDKMKRIRIAHFRMHDPKQAKF